MAVLTAMVSQGLGAKNTTAEDFIVSKEYKLQKATEDDMQTMKSEDVQSFFSMLSTPME